MDQYKPSFDLFWNSDLRRVHSAAGWALLLLLLLAGVRLDAAPVFDQGPILSLSDENDFVAGTDRWNTQSAKIAFLQGDNQVPHWTHTLFEQVPTLGFATGAERIGYELGQSMFTPANTHSSDLQPNDRPYAGWLYGGLILQRRGVGWGDALTLESFELQLGMIGPESFAGNMQTWYHHRAPQGWENQLKDEPGIALKYGRAWLVPLSPGESRFWDVIPQGGLSAGNVDTSFRAGATVRLGWNLPDNFGVQPIESVLANEGGWSPSRLIGRYGFYLFSGVEGRAVLYTAFLDGNAFRESHHIDKEPLVGEWRGGLVLMLNRVALAYTHILRTREFEGQPANQIYGSLTVQCNF